jgi:hypothetical protein
MNTEIEKNKSVSEKEENVVFHLIGISNDLKSKAMIGTFDSIERVVDIFDKNSSTILVYGTYKYFVLEKYMINNVNCECFGDNDFETWFEVDSNKNVFQVEKPEQVKHLIGLSHKCSLY